MLSCLFSKHGCYVYELMFYLCLKTKCLNPLDLLSVYGVAVARRSSKSVIVGNLSGRRSCHGPVYSPAGWVLPVQHSLSSEHNNSTSCEPNKGTSSFLKIYRCCLNLTEVLLVTSLVLTSISLVLITLYNS